MNGKIHSLLTASLGILLVVPLGFGQIRHDGRSAAVNRQLMKIRAFEEGLSRKPISKDYAPDQVLVKFRKGVTAAYVNAAISAYRAQRMKHIPGLDIHQIRIPQGQSVSETLAVMRLNPDIAYAVPNHRASVARTPRDTLFDAQYALYNQGQSIGAPGSPRGQLSADIKATAGWEETRGSSDIVIAVLDTGVDMLHPDLAGKIAPGGYDFVNEDDDATDDNGHGTMAAGIAAADTDNNEGIAGVAWDCMILPVKVMDEEGSGYYSWIIEGIRWAADNGAHVINLSLGGDESDPAMEDALRYANERGVVIVASAGNDGDSVLYPAAYDSYCLAVAATDYNDLRPNWSNPGPQVDVAAPGERIISCVPTWFWGPNSLPYAWGFGTSFSAPFVAGQAALIISIKPWLSPSEIMNIIRYTADDVNADTLPGRDDEIGYGRINLDKSLVPIKISNGN